MKNIIYVKKDYIWNPSTCSCENGKYLASIIECSAIMYDELIETDDAEKKKLMKRKQFVKTENLYILLAFLLISVGLLIPGSIYCYLKKHRGKQKHLLPFDNTNNELEHILY